MSTNARILPDSGGQEYGVVVLEGRENGLPHEGVRDDAAGEDDEHGREPQRKRMLPRESQSRCNGYNRRSCQHPSFQVQFTFGPHLYRRQKRVLDSDKKSVLQFGEKILFSIATSPLWTLREIPHRCNLSQERPHAMDLCFSPE